MNQAKGRRVAVESEPPTRDQLLADNGRLRGQLDALKNSRRDAGVTSVIKTFLRCACVFGSVTAMSYYLAGRTTNLTAYVDAKVSSSSLKEIAEAITPPWWILLALFIALVVSIGVAMRLFRTTRSQATRIGELTQRYETLIDPGRSSSGIAKSGATHEKDKI
ncbi:hypothetical protein HBF26_05040 [Luteibacter jiangsuensis]|uniref:Superfamily III holin-X n=1 Tax=Luteibacter jiangsuensis TaxID=637577 RepID=A0ABX0Q144_9GAMM|nr:hypothetical protein [Luteibacter jiangsuensis]NID04240.1 hypothetical protein [Luteibacter jiangsuensis]